MPVGRKSHQPPGPRVIDVLWITAGLGCDGDTIAVTAAMQPSLEDLVLGLCLESRRFVFTTRYWLMRTATTFYSGFTKLPRGSSTHLFSSSKAPSPTRPTSPTAIGHARRRRGDPPTDSYLSSGSTGWPPRPGLWPQPALAPRMAESTPCKAIPPAAWVCPTISGGWKSKAGIPIVCVPGCPVQPDNFMETLLYLLYQAAGLRADDPAG